MSLGTPLEHFPLTSALGGNAVPGAVPAQPSAQLGPHHFTPVDSFADNSISTVVPVLQCRWLVWGERVEKGQFLSLLLRPTPHVHHPHELSMATTDGHWLCPWACLGMEGRSIISVWTGQVIFLSKAAPTGLLLWGCKEPHYGPPSPSPTDHH